MTERKTDGELTDTFKQAANALASLYKQSAEKSKVAYSTGYDQALKDIWEYTSSQDINSSIQRAHILQFIQQKHSEQHSTVFSKAVVAPSIPLFEPLNMPDNMPLMQAVSPKRRPMDISNDRGLEHSNKRSRTRTDRMNE